MTAQNPGLDEEEIILAFSVEPTHDRKTLERYLREYPEYTDALVECSIELMVGATRSDSTEIASEIAVDQAWQRFQTIMNQPNDTVVMNPFAKLNSTDFKTLAKRLDINNLLLVRLRDRAIDVATIPQRFVQKLATELGATEDAVSTYLSSPPGIVSSHNFKSAVKPAVTTQISFEQAITTSQLTQPQQEALKALID